MTGPTSSLPALALIPAAGHARRLHRLPCSKELMPIGFQRTNDRAVRPRVALEYLLDQLVEAGVDRGLVLLREGKWDIPAYFGDGTAFGLPLAYCSGPATPSLPATLDRAFPFSADARIVLGFPDVLFEPAGAFRALLDEQTKTEADVVLGLFPVEDCRTTDMVEVDEAGRVQRIETRPLRTELTYNWLIAVWTPAFSLLVHKALCREDAVPPCDDEPEFQLGTLFSLAISEGLDVRGVPFPEGSFLDLGTPRNLAEAQRRHARIPD